MCWRRKVFLLSRFNLTCFANNLSLSEKPVVCVCVCKRNHTEVNVPNCKLNQSEDELIVNFTRNEMTNKQMLIQLIFTYRQFFYVSCPFRAWTITALYNFLVFEALTTFKMMYSWNKNIHAFWLARISVSFSTKVSEDKCLEWTTLVATADSVKQVTEKRN